jgi:hypothetical protein
LASVALVGVLHGIQTASAQEPDTLIQDAEWSDPFAGPRTLFQWSSTPSFDAEEQGDPGDDPIVTDRPDFTEASSTVGLGRVQLEAGYTFVHDDRDGVRTNGHAFGEPLLRAGILDDWLELRVGWNYFLETMTARAGREEIDGADDLYLGFKIALTEQAGPLPEMAIIPQAFVPIGADAFTSDEFLPGLNWLYSWEITECLSIGGSTQGNRVQDETGHSFTLFAQSLTAAYSLTDELGGYTEWFGLFPHSAQERGIGAEHFFNGGFTYLVNDDLQLDIRAGVGLNERAADFFTGAGFSRRW